MLDPTTYAGRHESTRQTEGAPMSAQPVPEPHPDDPVETLRVLPERFHDQFLTEYRAAVEQARRPEQYRQLNELLRLWRLRALAYSDPDYDDRLTAASHGTGDVAPAEQVIPGWPSR